MKTTAKIFIWLGMIFKFFLIYPIIVGAIALHKFYKEAPKGEIKQFGVVTLFFCSFLGGLFMILSGSEESDLRSELFTISSLYYDQVITETEFKNMREKIIENYIK